MEYTPEQAEQVLTAIEKVKRAIEGLDVALQLATMAQVTGYLLMSVEHVHGKDLSQKARETFATGLRNVCAQWRKEFRSRC